MHASNNLYEKETLYSLYDHIVRLLEDELLKIFIIGGWIKLTSSYALLNWLRFLSNYIFGAVLSSIYIFDEFSLKTARREQERREEKEMPKNIYKRLNATQNRHKNKFMLRSFHLSLLPLIRLFTVYFCGFSLAENCVRCEKCAWIQLVCWSTIVVRMSEKEFVECFSALSQMKNHHNMRLR